MTDTNAVPSITAELRDIALSLSEDAEDARNWGAVEHAYRNSTRATRLRALADALEQITRDDVERLLWENRSDDSDPDRFYRRLAAKLAALLPPE